MTTPALQLHQTTTRKILRYLVTAQDLGLPWVLADDLQDAAGCTRSTLHVALHRLGKRYIIFGKLRPARYTLTDVLDDDQRTQLGLGPIPESSPQYGNAGGAQFPPLDPED